MLERTDSYVSIYQCLLRYAEPAMIRFQCESGAKNTDLFIKLVAYMDQNLDAPISLNAAADSLFISQPSLSRLVRAHTACSFNEFLTRKRMKKAAQLMEQDPSQRMNQVALRVGYSDPHYFSRIFKETYGWTPQEYCRHVLEGRISKTGH